MKNKENYRIPQIELDNYDYMLPASKIADYPESRRSISKLLYADIKNNNIRHHSFNEITDLMPADALMIINSTKVIAARLFFRKPTGGKIELLCVDPLSPSIDPQITMKAKKQCRWLCIVGGKNVKEGMELIYINDEIDFRAEVIERFENKAVIEFRWSGKDLTFSNLLEKAGKMPLPPYIKREAEEQDTERYQTVYARSEGSVAAPTAGLHFTDEILNTLRANKNICLREVLLHVGPGTFVPVESSVGDHEMHKEKIFVGKDNIKALLDALNENQNIIATGTTSVRTIESLHWLGAKIKMGYDFQNGSLISDQWDPYNMALQEIDADKSLKSLLHYMELHNIEILQGETKLFILPGYDFKFINGIITNYHLPKSTLILLIAAFAGDMWKEIYNSALEKDYRFLSYGDSSFLFKSLK